MSSNLERLMKAQEECDHAAIAGAYTSDPGYIKKEDRLPLFFLSDHDITARLVMDPNGKWLHEVCQYLIKGIPVYDEATGERKSRTIMYRINGIQKKNASGVLYWDYKTNDPLFSYAMEAGKVAPSYSKRTGKPYNAYLPQIYTRVYAEVTAIRKGEDLKHTLGPCVLIESDKRRRLTEVNEALRLIQRRAEKKGKEALERIASSFDPRQEGMLCDIRYTWGQNGSCTASFDPESFGHVITPPDAIEKFRDITSEFTMKLDATNEKNGEILKEHFKRIIAAASSGISTSPDPIKPKKVSHGDEDSQFDMDTLDAAQASGQ